MALLSPALGPDKGRFTYFPVGEDGQERQKQAEAGTPQGGLATEKQLTFWEKVIINLKKPGKERNTIHEGGS
jgi:hypothetical protein